MPKATITRAEYQQLLGLGVIAHQHTRALSDIVNSVKQITGDTAERDTGHCDDFVYASIENMPVDELLRKLKITIDDSNPKGKP